MLAEVDLELPPGTVLALRAVPETTGRCLLQVLAGVTAPSAGDAHLGDISLREAPWAFRRQVGYMPAEAGVYSRVTVAELLAGFARAHGFGRVRRRQAPIEMMELFDLTDLADRWLTELDAAQQARLAFARALLGDPQLLLLERPFEHLQALAGDDEAPDDDAAARAEAEAEAVRHEWQEILRELAGMGKIVIIHTARPHRLDGLAGRIAILEDGVLLPEEMVERIAPRLGREVFVRLKPVDPAHLQRVAYLLDHTQGFRQVRLVGPREEAARTGAAALRDRDRWELIATYEGPLDHAIARIEAKLDAAGIPLRRLGERRVRPSRLAYEP